MKLYYSKGACSLAVRIIINELNLPCEYESVDLKNKLTESGFDYLNINSKGGVPALLTDDEQILTENGVIQQYLAELVHATQLLPPVGNFKRYRVLEWQNYVATELHKGFSPLFNPAIPQEIKEQIFIPIIHAKFTHVDKHLHHNQFLLGDDFTLPDAYMTVILNWAKPMGINVSQWTHLSRYNAALRERKSVQLSFQQEGLK